MPPEARGNRTGNNQHAESTNIASNGGSFNKGSFGGYAINRA